MEEKLFKLWIHHYAFTREDKLYVGFVADNIHLFIEKLISWTEQSSSLFQAWERYLVSIDILLPVSVLIFFLCSCHLRWRLIEVWILKTIFKNIWK